MFITEVRIMSKTSFAFNQICLMQRLLINSRGLLTTACANHFFIKKDFVSTCNYSSELRTCVTAFIRSS